MPLPLVRIQHLTKEFPINGTPQKVLLDVNLDIYEGEILGLVGASGSGKTTLGKIILNLISPTNGTIFYQGINISALKSNKFQSYRKELQMVFQHPKCSLTPTLTVEELLLEPLQIHGHVPKEKQKERALQVLELVGLSSHILQTYPYQLSGGQSQRVAIARVLAVNPKFIVFDEAVSALDVSLQAQILNLLKDLKKRLNLTYLFISHDLSVVRYISDRIAVLQGGRIVESGATLSLFENPKHPYTNLMLSSLGPPKKLQQLSFIPSQFVLSENRPERGCSFREHCPRAKAFCWDIQPPLQETEKGHLVACHLPLANPNENETEKNEETPANPGVY